tara:strand:- start:3857 stop:4504 length:648 start_codon:yes stop_codon:yes gene_type:complete
MGNCKNKKQFFQSIFPDSNINLLLEDFGSDWNFNKHKQNDISPRTTAIMYYSVYKANLLKKEFESSNGFLYDVVIRARMDFLLKETISEYELRDVIINNKTVYVGTNLHHKGRSSERMNWSYSGRYGVEDQLAFGSSKAMDKYSDCYLDRVGMQSIGGEIILGEQFQQYDLQPKRTAYQFLMLQHYDENESTYWEDYDEYVQRKFIRSDHIEETK